MLIRSCSNITTPFSMHMFRNAEKLKNDPKFVMRASVISCQSDHFYILINPYPINKGDS